MGVDAMQLVRAEKHVAAVKVESERCFIPISPKIGTYIPLQSDQTFCRITTVGVRRWQIKHARSSRACTERDHALPYAEIW
jgi:hypothetical protein